MSQFNDNIADQLAKLVQISKDYPKVIGVNTDVIGDFQADSWAFKMLMMRGYFGAPGVYTDSYKVASNRYIDTGNLITVIKNRHTKATGRDDFISSDKIQRLNPMGTKSAVEIPITRYTSDSVPLLLEDWLQIQAFTSLVDAKLLWDNERRQITVQNEGLGVRLKDSDILKAASGNTTYYEKAYDGSTASPPILVPKTFGFDAGIFPAGLVPMNIAAIQAAVTKLWTSRITRWNEPVIGFTSVEVFSELYSQFKYGPLATGSQVQYVGPNSQNPYYTTPESLKFGNFELYPLSEDLKKWSIEAAEPRNLGIILIGKRAFSEYFPMQTTIENNRENGVGAKNNHKTGGKSPNGFYHVEETVIGNGTFFLERLQYYCGGTWGFLPGEYNNGGLILLNPKGTYNDYTEQLPAIAEAADAAYKTSISDNIIPVTEDGKTFMKGKTLEIR